MTVTRGFFVAAGIYGAAWLLFARLPDVGDMPAILMLLGALFMLVSGLGYALAARLTGQPPYSVALARVQFWLATVGLVGSVAALNLPPSWSPLLTVGALAVAAASYAFLFNLRQSFKIRPLS